MAQEKKEEVPVFLHSLDFPACMKVFLCCAISASRKGDNVHACQKERTAIFFPNVFILGG